MQIRTILLDGILITFYFQGYQLESNLQNPIADLINDLLKQVRNLVDAANATATTLFKMLTDLANKNLNTFLAAASKVLGPVLEEVERIIGEATANGKDVAKCSADQVVIQLKNLPDLFFNVTSNCVNSQLDGANKLVVDTKKSVSYYC